jgi:AraC-like DNA-binding protein
MPSTDLSASTGLSASYGDAERLQAAASATLVPLRVIPPGHAAFQVQFKAASAGPVAVARIRGTRHVVTRDVNRISSADRDLIKVTLHRGGPAIAAQGPRQSRAAPGDLLLFDTTRPYRLALTGACDVVAIGLPRGMLGSRADRICARAATPLRSDTGFRAVIAAFLSALGDQAGDLPGTPGIHVADALASLLIAAFAETAPERICSGTSLADRIAAYSLANLGDPALSAESVARRHGISVRQLHQLFRSHDRSFAAWVRYQRLHRIRRDLLDPTLAGRTVAAIAARWGVCDPAHLGRALKQEFGQTAAEIRRTGPDAGPS